MKPQFKLAASLMIAATAAQVAHPALAAPSVTGKASAGAGVSGPQTVVPGEILVTYKEDAGSVRASNIRSFVGATNAETLGSRRIQRLQLPAGLSIAQAIEQLQSQSVVASVQPNYLYQKTQFNFFPTPTKTPSPSATATPIGSVSGSLTPNDPKYGSQWGPKKIQAPQAWKAFPPSNAPVPGDANLVVAVIDTGINYNHEDLKNNMWKNPGETPGNGKDDDNNGYVDDYYGINAYANTSDPIDLDGHGTHVAGIVGAVGNNSLGIAGLNFKVKLLGVKVLSDFGGGTSATVVKGLKYVVALKEAGRNIRVANHSYGDLLPAGTVVDPAVQTEFDKLGELGIVSAVSAGNENNNNDGSFAYPTSLDSEGVISVAASNSSDQRASFSNYGEESVDIAAPGTGIISTYPYETIPGKKYYPNGDYTKPPQYTEPQIVASNKGYKELDGTSMAAPHVAGAAALLFAYKPSATSQNVISWIRAGVDTGAQWTGVVKWGGRLNIARSMISAGAPISGIPAPAPTQVAPTATPVPSPTAPPAAPTGLIATPGNSQVTLKWNAASGASLGYNVYMSTTAGGPYSFFLNTAGTTTIVSNLTNGVPYYFIVRSMNSLGESANSNEATATPNGPSAAPLNLTATGGNSQVVLNWTASAGATSYNIYRSTSPFTTEPIASGHPTFILASGVTGTTYTDTSVNNGTPYYYRIRAVNAAGTGPESNQASATPQAPAPTAPDAPTGLSATAGSNTTINLTWNAVTGATSYNVFRSTTNGGPYTKINASPVAATTYVDSAVSANITYYYVVRAVNATGESANSNQASATPVGKPGAPGSLVAIAGDKQISLSWSNATGAASYSIYRSETTGGPYTLIINQVTGNNYTDTGLENGKTYYYVVRGVNSAGEGPNSNESSATPLPAPPATGGNGDVVYSNGGEIYRITNTGGSPINLSGDPANDFSPAVNQQDGRVVFVSRLNDLNDVNNELYIMNANGSNQTRLTENDYDDRDPSWSPDGQWVAFVRDSSGGSGTPNYDIYIMKPQPENTVNPEIGINIPIRITTHEGIDRDPAWSRDKINGNWRLAFTSNRAGLGADGSGTNADNDIWVVDFNPSTSAVVGSPANVTAFRDINLNSDTNQGKDDRNPSFGPVTFSTITQQLQYRIAYQSDRDGDYEIYTILNNGNGINTSSVPTRITNNSTQSDESYYWEDKDEMPNGGDTDTNGDPTGFDSFGTGGWFYPGDSSGYMYDPYGVLKTTSNNVRWSPAWDGPGPGLYGPAPFGDYETVEDIDPHFSPDGKSIVYSSNQSFGVGRWGTEDNDFDLFVIGVDSRGQRRLTTNKANGNSRFTYRFSGVQDSEPQWGVQVGTGVPPGSVVVTGFSSQTTRSTGKRSIVIRRGR